MDFGKFRFCGCALQYAEMRADRNRPHLQLPLFLLTCHTGICIVGAQKQSLPKLFVSNPFFVQAGHGLDPLESNMRIFSSRWLMWWTYAAHSSGGKASEAGVAEPFFARKEAFPQLRPMRHEPSRRREATCSRFALSCRGLSRLLTPCGPQVPFRVCTIHMQSADTRHRAGSLMLTINGRQSHAAPGRLFRYLSCSAAAPSRRVTSRLRLFCRAV